MTLVIETSKNVIGSLIFLFGLIVILFISTYSHEVRITDINANINNSLKDLSQRIHEIEQEQKNFTILEEELDDEFTLVEIDKLKMWNVAIGQETFEQVDKEFYSKILCVPVQNINDVDFSSRGIKIRFHTDDNLPVIAAYDIPTSTTRCSFPKIGENFTEAGGITTGVGHDCTEICTQTVTDDEV